MSNIPKIRFKGFNEDWEQRKLSDLVERGSTFGAEKEPPRVEYEDIISGTGKLNKDIYTKVSNKAGLKFRAGDVLYGKLRPYLKNWLLPSFSGLAVGDFWVLQPQNIDSRFLYSLIQSDRFDEVANQSTGTKMPRADWNLVSKTEFAIPSSMKEQGQIGQFLLDLDNLITLHQRKCDELSKLKKFILQKMFPKANEQFPEIRFKGFTEAWEQRKLGEIAPLRGGFAFKSDEYASDGIPIIRISNILSDGSVGAEFAHYPEQNNDTAYFLSNGAALLAMSGATTGKVSILHCKDTDKYYQNQRVGFFVPTSECDYGLVSIIVRSQYFMQQLDAVLEAGAQPNVSAKDIDAFEFKIPTSYDEQKMIGEYFKNLDDLITLHQRQLRDLQNIKKYMLQNMFV